MPPISFRTCDIVRLEQIERVAQGKRFILCLDEFERLGEVIEATKSRVPLNFLRHVLQHHRQWIVLFCGSHMLSELETYWSDYLINTCTLRVSYLEEPDARQLITQPVEGFPEIYETAAVEYILKLTRCQPYLIQLICEILVEHLNRQQRMLVTCQDVDDIIPRIFAQGAMYFKEFWQLSLTSEEQNLLLHQIRTSSRRTSLHPPQMLVKSFFNFVFRGENLDKNGEVVLHKLLQKEVIEKVEDGYRFQVPLMELFIEREVMKET